MLCYRDRTYCGAQCFDCPATCDRILTPEVQAAADQWWGKPGAPIAISPPRMQQEPRP